MRYTTLTLLCAAGLSLATLATPKPAAACGGFFCNNQGIDQSGEDILFSYNADGTITTVVQIAYQGPSEEFAWILPVPAEPTVGVGTDAIFTQLRNATQPRYSLQYETQGSCRDEPRCGGYWGRDDFDNAEPSFEGGAADASAPAADAGATVDVSFRGAVGPFDVAVLRAGDGDVLREWLSDNGYEIPEAAGNELDHYVALDHYFVALRLLKDRGTGEIQPIVLTSSSPEPCIPIRLTRIATVPDMPIRAYFLADRRARPMNFMLTDVDENDLRLYTGQLRYDSAVSEAVDDAGGHAFVTDYSGDVPELFGLELPRLDDLREVTDRSQFLQRLRERGFQGDSRLLSVLTRHMEPPEGQDPQGFYNCLFFGGGCGEDAAPEFSPSELVDALHTSIVDPREQAQAMLDDHSTLTRLFTTMSAEEMTEDPMFVLSSELTREHSNLHQATVTTHCSAEYFQWTAPQTLTLPSGATSDFRDGVPYRGSDAQYCEDRYDGDFHPGAPMDRLREVSRERDLVAGGGGGLCSASRTSTSLGSLGALGLGLLALVWRRRRAR